MSDRADLKPEQDLVAGIDAALVENPISARNLVSDVMKTRREVAKLCRLGRYDEARRVTELCLNIIRQGDPVKE